MPTWYYFDAAHSGRNYHEFQGLSVAKQAGPPTMASSAVSHGANKTDPVKDIRLRLK